MQLGARLRELSKLRAGLAVSLVAGLLAALIAVYKVSLLPPGLHPRALQIGAASTEVLVDNPSSTAVNVGPGTVDSQLLTAHADLLGDIMASAPVLNYIGKAVGVDPARIQATAPITADVPRVVVEPGSGQNATAIIASPDQYKLEIQADPSVPILHVYAQAPTARRAATLANSAVAGLSHYVSSQSTIQRIPAAKQVRVQQLGIARGGVANGGVAYEFAVLAFLAVFGVSCFLVLYVASLRRGWRTAKLAEQGST